MPRRPVSSWSPGVLAEAVVADLVGEDRADPGGRRWTARTSSTARAAALVEAIGASETSCAPNAQQSTQTTPSAMTACSDHRRWPAATRVRRRTARVVRTSTATTSTAPPTTTRFALRPSDRVAQRLDADPGVAPVVDGVERPVEGREEADVEDLHEHQQTQQPVRRPRPGRVERWRAGRGPGRRRRGPRAGASRTRSA